jgi:hypothetical protein
MIIQLSFASLIGGSYFVEQYLFFCKDRLININNFTFKSLDFMLLR